MTLTEINHKTSRVLVTDFDGTMSRYDFYDLATKHLLPPDVPNFWDQYRAGAITHFEALRGYFAAINVSEQEVLRVVERMELDPRVPKAVQSLQQAGWHIVIASAGCEWYIRWLLARAKVNIEIHANPGRFEPGRGLIMEFPTDSRYASPTLGIDKAGIVRDLLQQGRTVAFAGDGYPDVEAARLVSDPLRFARGALAETLTHEQLPFRPFAVWSDIAESLLQAGA